MLSFYGIQSNFLSQSYKLHTAKVTYEDEGLGCVEIIRGSNVQLEIWDSFGFQKIIEAYMGKWHGWPCMFDGSRIRPGERICSRVITKVGNRDNEENLEEKKVFTLKEGEIQLERPMCYTHKF